MSARQENRHKTKVSLISAIFRRCHVSWLSPDKIPKRVSLIYIADKNSQLRRDRRPLGQGLHSLGREDIQKGGIRRLWLAKTANVKYNMGQRYGANALVREVAKRS